jgi:hypothetical protein
MSIRAHARDESAGMLLRRAGKRLSVTPVDDAHWRFISRSNERARGVSKITAAVFSTRLLVILQRVYILGPRTNLTWRYSHGESKEEGQEESFEKEVGPSNGERG